ncbi:phosphatidylinositol transfer protein 2-like isoform X2 [Juglans microcarpa x Juglans regia]|uniref:phosphatidylinositol transfer protein 2-like isoform X2 n=1 Tax=Juglans microcarpa x Juglans regia TaxID=2249226 RepID=UPI001B7F2A38|nr:phosphatidylinositol transfer protein 2-like isoform X2 [Juglans microcarpa x Juglans regia]
MVQIKEFRIVMPMSLEEYHVAHMYIVMKMSQQHTTGDEGIEVVENRSFEDNVLGKGRYTNKIYRLQSKVPSWLTTFAPSDALIVKEEAWNAFPKCKSVMKCPYFPRFQLTLETVHRPDKGQSENVHGLSEEQLAVREVEYIDIASSEGNYWSYLVGNNDVDFSEFKSERTGRGPLLEGWQNRCNPVMTAYKLVTIDAPYWGFGSRLEQALIAGEKALFLESHRNCFSWIDEWYGMTVQQIYELEQLTHSALNEKLGKPALITSAED